MNNINWSELVVNVLIAGGAFGGVRYLALWLVKRFQRGRNTEQQQAQITAAQRLQTISLELVEPIRAELAEARQEAREARHEAAQLRREMDETLEDWLEWMQRAKATLEDNGLPVEPLPGRAPARHRRRPLPG